MAFFNYVTKEIILKVVYYGPGLSGKTTNLQHLYSLLDPSSRGKFISLATESDRTLFFDFLPVELGKIKDFTVRFQLYTVPGQIRYNATRKLVLKGVDAVVFVADSQREMKDQNIESLSNMRENLTANSLNPDEIPVVMQYNKRDLSDIASIDELNSDLNKENHETIEATAVNGKGVEETFRLVTKILLKEIARKHKAESAEVIPSVIHVPDNDLRDEAPPGHHHVKGDGLTIKVQDKSYIRSEESPPPLSRNYVRPEEGHLPPSKSYYAGTEASPPSPSKNYYVGAEESPAFPSKSYVRPEENPPAAIPADFKKVIAEIQNTLSLIQKEIAEARKQQSGIVDALKEIKYAIHAVGRKKGWFNFFSK